MTIAHPAWLAAGIVAAALLVAALRLGERRAADGALRYSSVAFVVAATRRRTDPALLVALAAALGLFALGAAAAGIRVVAPVAVPDAAIVLCVDTSGSMASTDVIPTRAAAAASAVRGFIDAVPRGTRVGIVAFSSQAEIVTPPRSDKALLREAVDAIPPPNGATAIGDALVVAARLLPFAARRAIVVVTDGVNNAGSDPFDDAHAIGARGVEIDTVGIGTAQSGRLVPGTAEEATIDEDALRTIAADGNGVYARAGDAGTLRARLGTLAARTTRVRRPVDLSLPLALAGGLVAVAALGTGMLAGRLP